MAQLERLSASEIDQHLEDLEGWARSDAELMKRFEFKTFADAIAFLVRVAPACEELNHHPDWSNTYNRVDVRLSTHDAGGITSLDIELASRMEDLF